ncbi:hypothetical protein CDD82_364 [Ophiocordyceps australis]|uniref:Uncharacterized protein n=1 Tax=Ophiocordyceps australis TaxID=1399860 RepID=A0A2C5XS01_9HYPO|nr:hypothetical protein CDD82_364 [Ophiocordyceps australis]
MDGSCPRPAKAPERPWSLAALKHDTGAVPSCPPLPHDLAPTSPSAVDSLSEPGQAGGVFLKIAGSQPPVELLVGQLENQSLDVTMGLDEDGEDSFSQGLVLGKPEPDNKLQPMDVDMQEAGEVETALSMVRHRMEATGFGKRYYSQAFGSATAGGPPIARAEQSSAQPRPASTTESKAPVEAQDSNPSMGGKLEADEGYCEGDDDMSWLGGDELMPGLSSSARSNGLLKFQTSAERAMQCSMVVRKTARMRRRRHHKREIRKRPPETETATTAASTVMGK